MRTMTACSLALLLVATAAPASASTLLFSGSRTNVDAPGPAAARCGARNTNNIRNAPPTATSVGVSNLGTFTPTLSHCIQLPLSTTSSTVFDLGEFVFDFGLGDTLVGTYSGALTPQSAGVFSISQSHIVTGGTGFFASTTGTFDSSGTLSFLSGRPTVTQTFSGTLTVPAVPEPATWLMLIGGFGAIGFALRRRARRSETVAGSLSDVASGGRGSAAVKINLS